MQVFSLKMPTASTVLVGGTIAAFSAFIAIRIHSLTKEVKRKFPNGLPFKHQMMAHRGGGREFIENTMPAFRNAAKMKADILELDVQMTRDQQIVIFHDKDLKRLCGVDGKISNFDYKDLPKLLIPAHLQGKIDSKDDEMTRIPLFDTLLEEFPQYPMQIDVKRGPEELVIAVGNKITSLERQSKTVWGSFLPSVNAMCFRHFGTDIPLFFGLYRALSAVAMYKLGLFKHFALRETCLIAPNFKFFMDPGFISALNSRGCSVIVFGSDGSGALNTKEQWERVQGVGVNGICTDEPTMILEWLQTNSLTKCDEKIK